MASSISLPDDTPPPSVILRPTKGWMALNLRELWEYRELVFFLTWRDIKVRYKQTVLGALWAILNPLINMVVLEFVFGRLAHLGTDGVPGPLFRFAALLPWGLFSKALTASGRSMLTNRSLITKVYFPRLAVPLASVFGGLVDFTIAFFVLLAMILAYGVPIPLQILLVPVGVLMTLIAVLGVGLWLSALNVLYRDVGYIIPVLTQILLFLSPVGYSISSVSPKWQWIFALNPMTGVIEAFRWMVLGVKPKTALPLETIVAISFGVALVLFITGLFFFRRMERRFADVV